MTRSIKTALEVAAVAKVGDNSKPVDQALAVSVVAHWATMADSVGSAHGRFLAGMAEVAKGRDPLTDAAKKELRPAMVAAFCDKYPEKTAKVYASQALRLLQAMTCGLTIAPGTSHNEAYKLCNDFMARVASGKVTVEGYKTKNWTVATPKEPRADKSASAPKGKPNLEASKALAHGDAALSAMFLKVSGDEVYTTLFVKWFTKTNAALSALDA